jgi:hypothetical protein
MEDDGTGRMRSVSHLSSIHKKKDGVWIDRQKRYRFDYQAGKVFQENGDNGIFSPGPVFELPAGNTPVDLLTGFYNLRAGIYGTIAPGKTLRIPTFTSKGVSEIEVEVMEVARRQSLPFFPANGTLVQLKIDPEVTDVGDVALYVWFDDAGRPARGVLGNVIGLGDVEGRLLEEEKQP